MTSRSQETERPLLRVPRPRAVLLGAAMVIALTFLIPYFNLSLNKFDWAFRPLAVGPVFLLFLLALPANTLLRRIRPRWAFTGSELLLVYAMMAISAALSGEGLFGYATVHSVHPLYFASPENRWLRDIMPNVPLWLQVDQPEAVRWFFEGMPAGAAIRWSHWVSPMLAWGSFGLALYCAFFALSCMMRKDWIEGQRLSFPIAALPIEMAGDPVPSAGSSFFRNRLLWIGVALPVVQSMVQMAHAFVPSIPYSPLYFHPGRWFAGNGIWNSISNTYAYVGFETIGILALMPAELSFSLWFFYFINRLQIFTFAALGFGEESVGASVFSPSAFITYQEAGAVLMLALLLIWQSRRPIAIAFRNLVGRPAPYDPMDPLRPGVSALLLLLSMTFLFVWIRRAGMDYWAFAALLALLLAYSLTMARLVAAGGIFVPDASMAPRELLVGLTGAAAFSPASLTMMTYLQAIFMAQWKVNFLHYNMNDLKVVHSARLPGKVVAVSLLLAVVLMIAIVPWVNIHAAYTHGAQTFDTWQFRDSGNYQYAELAASLRTPEAATPYLTTGLLCGAAVVWALNWLHTNFLWWGLSPIGFIMGGTWAMNTRIWTNAFIAWLLVSLLRRFGGLKLYAKFRPVFIGMILGHVLVMALRSMVDPMLGLYMQLSPWA